MTLEYATQKRSEYIHNLFLTAKEVGLGFVLYERFSHAGIPSLWGA